MKSRIREEVARCEEAFGLLSLELGGEFALSTAEQVRQLDALQVVHSALTHVCEVRGDPTLVTGLVMRIYHPHSAPMDLPSTACVVDDGALHLVADPDRLRDALVSLDFSQARSLSRLNSYWQRRTRELTGPVRELLGVSHVWADSRTDSDLQRFVMWAGALLRDSDTFGQALRGTKFSFSGALSKGSA